MEALATKKSTVCLVLLATFNGETHLKEQLNSIQNQSKVDTFIVASDDCSSDNTPQLLNEATANQFQLIVLPIQRMGGAAANFFRLLSDADFSKIDYVALSDQDDIWYENKLSKAIDLIVENSADGYSSNVTAFWTNGAQRLVSKAQPQQEYDYMFESAGPGCTFVLTKKLALNLQEFLSDNQEKCKNVALHDWFIYAFARSHHYSWFIDEEPYALYRQHQNNVIGANIGIKAKINRWEKMRNGWHIKQAILIADILGYSNKFPIRELKNYSFIDRLILIVNVRKMRRRLRDCCALAIFFLFPLKK